MPAVATGQKKNIMFDPSCHTAMTLLPISVNIEAVSSVTGGPVTRLDFQGALG
jgi:hypothetical protein